MRRLFLTIQCLALFLPVARASAAPSNSVQEYRRLLASPDCQSRVAGLRGLFDKVPPTELFDDAWACSDASYADPDTQKEAREILRRLVGRRDRIMVPQILATM